MKTLKRKLIVLFVLILGSLEAFPALAEEKDLDGIIASIQEKYRTIKSIEADFVQKNFIAALNQFREFRGKIFLQKPHLFDLEVSFPSQQRQTFDGRFVWIYTSANNQVLKNPVAPDFFNHPLINLITTMADLKKNFFISLGGTKTAQDYSLKLTLKTPKTGFREILISGSKNNFQIQELTVYYDSGNYTQLALTNIKENSNISPDHFQFILLPGVEIVESPAPPMQP